MMQTTCERSIQGKTNETKSICFNTDLSNLSKVWSRTYQSPSLHTAFLSDRNPWIGTYIQINIEFSTLVTNRVKGFHASRDQYPRITFRAVGEGTMRLTHHYTIYKILSCGCGLLSTWSKQLLTFIGCLISCGTSVVDSRRRTFPLNVDLSATVVIAVEVESDYDLIQLL